MGLQLVVQYFADSAYSGAFSSAVLHGTCVVDQLVCCFLGDFDNSNGEQVWCSVKSEFYAQVPGYRMLFWFRDSVNLLAEQVRTSGS